MPVYALYIPTARRPVTGIGMEVFTSRELTGRVLKERNATGRSKSFYVADGKQPWDREPVEFPMADETGYMRVFLRYATDPVPDLLDTPDEEWLVEDTGKVTRLPWGGASEQVAQADDKLYVVPQQVVPDYEVRTPTSVKPAVKPCGSCFMVPSVTGRCGCS